MGVAPSRASAGAVTRRTGCPSSEDTLQSTNEQHLCSAAASSASSSPTPSPGRYRTSSWPAEQPGDGCCDLVEPLPTSQPRGTVLRSERARGRQRAVQGRVRGCAVHVSSVHSTAGRALRRSRWPVIPSGDGETSNGWQGGLVGLDRAVLFRLATSERWEWTVKTLPGGADGRVAGGLPVRRRALEGRGPAPGGRAPPGRTRGQPGPVRGVGARPRHGGPGGRGLSGAGRRAFGAAG